MDQVPPYLALYLWKIRRHSGEPGYLRRRLEEEDFDRVVYEESMLAELRDLHLVAFSEKHEEVPLGADRLGRARRTKVPERFVVLARGHYLWAEYLVPAAKWLVTAFLGALIALLISG